MKVLDERGMNMSASVPSAISNLEPLSYHLIASNFLVSQRNRIFLMGKLFSHYAYQCYISVSQYHLSFPSFSLRTRFEWSYCARMGGKPSPTSPLQTKSSFRALYFALAAAHKFNVLTYRILSRQSIYKACMFAWVQSSPISIIKTLTNQCGRAIFEHLLFFSTPVYVLVVGGLHILDRPRPPIRSQCVY